MTRRQALQLRIGRERSIWTPIDSWSHASALVCAFVAQHDLTASGRTGPQFTGGEIRDARGGVIARVSYNGNVWGPEAWPHAALLFDAQQERRDAAR